jgi:hypothetical protein
VAKPDPPPKPVRVQTVIQFRTVDELLGLARALYAGGVAPPGVDRPEKLLPIILSGMEVGLGVMQSVVSVTPPVNGRCALYGDAGKALVLASGQLEYQRERVEGDGDARKGVVEVKRVGFPARTFEYTVALAKKLRGWGKPNTPWANDPDNMLLWRARWRAWRAEFADVLAGLHGREEDEDEAVTVEVAVSPPPPPAPAALPAPTPAAAPAVAGEVMVDAEQLAELKRLRDIIRVTTPDANEQKRQWAAALAPFGVDSATKLTRDQADAMIRAVGEAHDPFSHPRQTPPY